MKKSLEQGGRCDKCLPNPCKCHPCYDVTVGDCNQPCDDTPVEVDPCVGQEFCDDTCDPSISTDCFILPNGDTLTVHLNNLFNLVVECCERTTTVLQTVREEIDACCNENHGCPFTESDPAFIMLDSSVTAVDGSLITVSFNAEFLYPSGDLSEFHSFSVAIESDDLSVLQFMTSSIPGTFEVTSGFSVDVSQVNGIIIRVSLYEEVEGIPVPVCSTQYSFDLPNTGCLTDFFDSNIYGTIGSNTCDYSSIGGDSTWSCLSDPVLFVNLCR